MTQSVGRVWRRVAGGLVVLLVAVAAAGFVMQPSRYVAEVLLGIQPGYPVPDGEFAAILAPILDTVVAAQIADLDTDSVLGSAVDNAGLAIVAEPVRMPLFGAAYARWRTVSDSPATAPAGLDRYAWGGEHISIGHFDISDALTGQNFLLTVLGDDRYTLQLPTGEPGLSGQVDALTTVPDGSVALRVDRVRANPGTRFRLRRDSRQRAISQLRSRLNVVRMDDRSSLYRVVLHGRSRDEVAATLDATIAAFGAFAADARRADAARDIAALSGALPAVAERRAIAFAEAGIDRSGHAPGSAGDTRLRDRIVGLERARIQLAMLVDQLAARAPVWQHRSASAVAAATRNIARLQSDLDRQRQAGRAPGDANPDRQYAALVADAAFQIHNEQIAALALYSARGVQPVRVLDAAREVTSERSRRLMFVLATFAGCVLIGLALRAAARRFARITSWIDRLEAQTGVPVLGIVAGLPVGSRYAAAPAGAPEDSAAADADHAPANAANDVDCAVASLAVGIAVELAAFDASTVCLIHVGAARATRNLAVELAQLFAASGRRVLVAQTTVGDTATLAGASTVADDGIERRPLVATTDGQVAGHIDLANLFGPVGGEPAIPQSRRVESLQALMRRDYDIGLFDCAVTQATRVCAEGPDSRMLTLLIINTAATLGAPTGRARRVLKQLAAGGISVDFLVLDLAKARVQSADGVSAR